jgi:hypothetical protein
MLAHYSHWPPAALAHTHKTAGSDGIASAVTPRIISTLCTRHLQYPHNKFIEFDTARTSM